MHLILLSGENLKLARLESESLLKLGQTNIKGNMLYCTIPSDSMSSINRLAYARKIYEILYTTSRKNLEASLEAYPWINIYEKNFCVRITADEHYDERYYAGFVWKSLEKSTRPKVNLENPELMIELFIKDEKATVARLIYQNFETFEDRKAHLRPVLHPTAMHPKMARALINILNPAPKDKIIDPFCGACGILTEAGLLGLKFEGYDINKNILEDARKNLEYYDINPEHYILAVKDSTKVKSLRNIVTDLPYGKSSKKSTELVTLYAEFLKNLSGRAVVVMPNFMPYKVLLQKNLPKSLAVIEIIDYYIHKSLTRKIVIIDVKGKKAAAVKEKPRKTKKTRKNISARKAVKKILVKRKKIVKKKTAKPNKIKILHTKKKIFKKKPQKRVRKKKKKRHSIKKHPSKNRKNMNKSKKR